MKNIYFNNASAGLLNHNFKEITNYFKLEKKYGLYEAERRKIKNIYNFYDQTAKLINSHPDEISFIQNSTLGWNLSFNSIFLNKNDEIIIFENEYTSNYFSILNRKKDYNKLKIVKINKFGFPCLDDLKKKLTKNTKIVSINHIASQCGTIMPLKQICNFIKTNFSRVVMILDVCQSIGHIPVNVKELKCDFLVASGRKYLRGPRGTGFIFASKKTCQNLKIFLPDLSNSVIDKSKNLARRKYKNFFEMYEYSPLLKLGLTFSIEQINIIGIKKIQKKITNLSIYFRKEANKRESIFCYEDEKYLSGINTMHFKEISIKRMYTYLLNNKIYTNICREDTSYLYFKRIKKKSILRLSFHYYNTKKEIDYFFKILDKYV